MALSQVGAPNPYGPQQHVAPVQQPDQPLVGNVQPHDQQHQLGQAPPIGEHQAPANPVDDANLQPVADAIAGGAPIDQQAVNLPVPGGPVPVIVQVAAQQAPLAAENFQGMSSDEIAAVKQTLVTNINNHIQQNCLQVLALTGADDQNLATVAQARQVQVQDVSGSHNQELGGILAGIAGDINSGGFGNMVGHLRESSLAAHYRAMQGTTVLFENGADLVVCGPNGNQAIQSKYVTSNDQHQMLENLTKAIYQLSGAKGETPPGGFERVADVVFEGPLPAPGSEAYNQLSQDILTILNKTQANLAQPGDGDLAFHADFNGPAGQPGHDSVMAGVLGNYVESIRLVGKTANPGEQRVLTFSVTRHPALALANPQAAVEAQDPKDYPGDTARIDNQAADPVPASSLTVRQQLSSINNATTARNQRLQIEQALQAHQAQPVVDEGAFDGVGGLFGDDDT